MGEAAPSNPSPKSYYSMDCEYRAHAAIFLARQEAACDPFSALNLSVDKFHLREHVQHLRVASAAPLLKTAGIPIPIAFWGEEILVPEGSPLQLFRLSPVRNALCVKLECRLRMSPE